ncbi:peptide chain release factor N(5)-glutamine methyltransferase [Laceyella sacchari]|jgi:release factor glutamine methyltransferase|uniref:Release factor glutamine methyltransferase n=1 Tax=Laceyella sacchari TaxID=37482 RepID=A0ABY5U6A8_LACSH|nr:peptide chain release factor N(5)-glutamine methyltransferase [Laceyella sacchari]TCW39272.1 release factor glutamine methyltransferase [Laceyella sacchari]UWE03573.1 peptide chain release factor N(5)-glutamine methyltransferase [Laceyella sacchari]
MHREYTLREAYRRASSFLQDNGAEENANFEAELLIRRLVGLDRTQFFMRLSDPFPTDLATKLEEWLRRRASGEPLQYIVGDQEFYGRVFQVSPAVLIPRPETELLIEAVIDEAERRFAEDELRVVDVGTGSGAIAVTLALEKPQWQLTAIDLSVSALEVAQMNAKRYGVREQICWLQGDLLAPLGAGLSDIDILVSNPPYIPSQTVYELERQVRDFEPYLALDGGEDGLSPYRRMVSALASVKAGPKLICFEIGADQGRAVAELLASVCQEVTVKQDLAGLDRIVVGWRSTVG